MATDRTFDEIVLSRRRLLGTAASAAAGAMLATGDLPEFGGRAVLALHPGGHSAACGPDRVVLEAEVDRAPKGMSDVRV